MLKRPEDTNLDLADESSFSRHENVSKLRSIASENIKEAQIRYKAQYDAKHELKVSIELKAGDSVLIENSKDKGRKGGRMNDRFKVFLSFSNK